MRRVLIINVCCGTRLFYKTQLKLSISKSITTSVASEWHPFYFVNYAYLCTWKKNSLEYYCITYIKKTEKSNWKVYRLQWCSFGRFIWSLSSFHYDRLALVVLVVSVVSFWWFRLFRFGGFGCFVLLFRFQCMLWSVIHVQYAQTVTIRSLTNRHTVNTPEVEGGKQCVKMSSMV